MNGLCNEGMCNEWPDMNLASYEGGLL